jgi:hypothetical protein
MSSLSDGAEEVRRVLGQIHRVPSCGQYCARYKECPHGAAWEEPVRDNCYMQPTDLARRLEQAFESLAEQPMAA